MIPKKKGKDNSNKDSKLVDYKDLERNVKTEIADELYKKPKK